MFSRGSAPRRFAGRRAPWLAGAALAVVAGAIAAVAVAHAGGPGGGTASYDAATGVHSEANADQDASGGLSALWSAARTPLRWLRQSGRRFQGLMRLLAERSAQQTRADAPPPAVTPPPVVSPKPPGKAAAEQPGKGAVEETEEPPRRQPVYGGEAGAGRTGGGEGGARVKEWHKRITAGSAQGEAAAACPGAGARARRGGWYVVKPGDTLSRIAQMHYGDGEAYPQLHRANASRVPDANLIVPCQRIYIPPVRHGPPVRRWRCCCCVGGIEAQTSVASVDRGQP